MTENIKLDPVVRSITILKRDENGDLARTAVYRNAPRKKKGTKALRPIEKFVRKLGRAQATAISVYNARHDRSNRKKKNGWLRDLIPNLMKTRKRASKSFKRKSGNDKD
jgi:Family of unknown function (DUF6312)